MARFGESELVALGNSAPVGLFVSTASEGVVLANRTLLEITDQPLERILGMGWLECVHPDDQFEVEAASNELRRSGNLDLEHRFVRPNGDVRWVRVRAVLAEPDFATSSLVGSIVDITDLRSVEDSLRQSEERFRAVVEQSFDIVSVIDPDGLVRYTSPSASRITGFPSSEGNDEGTNMFDRMHPDDVGPVNERLAEVVAQPGRSKPILVRIEHADGAWVTLEVVANNLLDDPRTRTPYSR
jgi:two-component system cell cycle sensor histidine kinase/response regulator CckA